MKKVDDRQEIHPKLGQIVDLEGLQEMFSAKDQIESHRDALEEELDKFYRLTGTNSEEFDEMSTPNVSRQVFAKWVRLRHDYLYQAPNYQFVSEYIELAQQVNQMLFSHDFDDCLALFEGKLRELNDQRVAAQMQRAMSDGIQRHLLERFEVLRKGEDSSLSEGDHAAIRNYVVEFLKEDHGWSDEQCAEVAGVLQQN